MGDRWRPDLLGSSRYIWLPLTWASGVPQLIWADVWTLNIAAGTWTIASGTSYEAENGVVSGSATIPSDPSFSGGKAVGFLGSSILGSSSMSSYSARQAMEAVLLLQCKALERLNGFHCTTPTAMLLGETPPSGTYTLTILELLQITVQREWGVERPRRPTQYRRYELFSFANMSIAQSTAQEVMSSSPFLSNLISRVDRTLSHSALARQLSQVISTESSYTLRRKCPKSA